MKNLTRFICVAACALLFTAALQAEPAPSDTFTQANEEFAAGRFREAIELYDQAIESGLTNATVFYNLGNAWFRAGDPGRAVLNYERALALQPGHPEATANLELVREKARGLQLRKNRLEAMTARITSNQFAIAAAISFWIAAFAVAALLFSRSRRAPLIALATLAAIFCAATISALYVRERRAARAAIVIGAGVEARLAAADNTGTVLVLPPGSEIRVLSAPGDWIYAALPNELRGWIPAQSAERVRL